MRLGGRWGGRASFQIHINRLQMCLLVMIFGLGLLRSTKVHEAAFVKVGNRTCTRFPDSMEDAKDTQSSWRLLHVDKAAIVFRRSHLNNLRTVRRLCCARTKSDVPFKGELPITSCDDISARRSADSVPLTHPDRSVIAVDSESVLDHHDLRRNMR